MEIKAKMNTKKIKENIEAETREYYEKELERVNSWLTFAEAKNAALIAANIGLFGFVVEFCDKHPITSFITLVILTISTILCLFSFTSILDNKRSDKNLFVNDNPNLIFFKDIAKIDNVDEYVKMVGKKYFDNNTIVSSMDKDLAYEIITNSKIALRKYNFFYWALKSEIIALLFLIIILFLCA